MKALVTGGGGFLGTYITEQLVQRGDQVRIFSRGDYPALSRSGVEVMRGDISDLRAITHACSGMDVVFHVAAHAGYWGTWESYYKPNMMGTENVIAACRAEKVPKLIYTSSPSVVFDNQSQVYADESLPYPVHYESYYAQTKALAEKKVIQANSSDLLTVSLRPHIIWGPRDTQILPRILARAKAGKLVQIGNGKNKVDLTYVEDAARAHLLAAEALKTGSPAAGRIYFINQDEPVSFWPWINQLLLKLDIPVVKRHYSLRAARTIGGLFELAFRMIPLPGEPRLTRFLASELALSHYYDCTRAKRELKYIPTYSMATALEKTVAYLKSSEGSVLHG